MQLCNVKQHEVKLQRKRLKLKEKHPRKQRNSKVKQQQVPVNIMFNVTVYYLTLFSLKSKISIYLYIFNNKEQLQKSVWAESCREPVGFSQPKAPRLGLSFQQGTPASCQPPASRQWRDKVLSPLWEEVGGGCLRCILYKCGGEDLQSVLLCHAQEAPLSTRRESHIPVKLKTAEFITMLSDDFLYWDFLYQSSFNR